MNTFHFKEQDWLRNGNNSVITPLVISDFLFYKPLTVYDSKRAVHSVTACRDVILCIYSLCPSRIVIVCFTMCAC